MSQFPAASRTDRKDTGSPREDGRVRVLTRLTRWVRAHPPLARARHQGCRACGACCEHFGGHLRVSRSDLERWEREGRDDLLERVGRLGWLWVNPATGRPLPRCPYLVKDDPDFAHCAIHDTKPDMCRAYPTLAHERRCVRGVVFH